MDKTKITGYVKIAVPIFIFYGMWLQSKFFFEIVRGKKREREKEREIKINN